MVCILSFIVKKKAVQVVTENSSTNAWNLNFSNGNANNNKKNSNRVRPVCAFVIG